MRIFCVASYLASARADCCNQASLTADQRACSEDNSCSRLGDGVWLLGLINNIMKSDQPQIWSCVGVTSTLRISDAKQSCLIDFYSEMVIILYHLDLDHEFQDRIHTESIVFSNCLSPDVLLVCSLVSAIRTVEIM